MHSHKCGLCDEEFTCSDPGCAGMEMGLCSKCDPQEEIAQPEEGGSYGIR